jgi:hypothetical protein
MHEVLSQQRYLQLLGACLLRPGECRVNNIIYYYTLL